MGAFVTLFNYIGYRLMLSPGIKPCRGRTVIRSLSHRHMELAESWRNDLTLWPGPVMLFSTAVMLGGLY